MPGADGEPDPPANSPPVGQDIGMPGMMNPGMMMNPGYNPNMMMMPIPQFGQVCVL